MARKERITGGKAQGRKTLSGIIQKVRRGRTYLGGAKSKRD